jgi:DNA/RNA-binding domain of Phe-tRNA-synthetase-like protein
VRRRLRKKVPVQVTVDPAVADRVCLGVVEAQGLVVRPEAPEVWEELDRRAGELRQRYAGRPPSEIEALQPARDLYRRVGEDPTKTRPSSEALLRRALRGQPMPRVNSLVDVCNLCSLEYLLPIGLYDLDRLQGPVVVRLGRPGEFYESLGKGLLRAAGRLVVCDAQGPVGSPTHDSARTGITVQTRAALAVVFGPGSYPAERMRGHAETLAVRFRQLASPRSVRWEVLGGRP